MTNASRLIPAVVAVLLLQAGVAGAQDSLAAAKQLYASASYDEALTMLDHLKSRGVADAAVSNVIEQYPRLLPPGRRSPAGRRARHRDDCRIRPCIPAGRGSLAAAAVGVPRRSKPNAARCSAPAVRGREGELRPEGVPGGSRSVRRGGVFAGLAGRRRGGPGTRGSSDGGLGLQGPGEGCGHAAAAAGGDPRGRSSRRGSGLFAACSGIIGRFRRSSRSGYYTADDAGVTAPVVIRQDLPPWPRGTPKPVQGGLRAVLDIVIDEAGTVGSVVVRQSIAPWFDELLVREAKRWSYKPATRNGTPVRYRKVVQVVVEG